MHTKEEGRRWREGKGRYNVEEVEFTGEQGGG